MTAVRRKYNRKYSVAATYELKFEGIGLLKWSQSEGRGAAVF
jgi:hypothetical protein